MSHGVYLELQQLGTWCIRAIKCYMKVNAAVWKCLKWYIQASEINRS